MDGLDARQTRTRAALIMAATELLDSLDPEQIKVKDLAERAGVTRMTLYLHFQDRDKLLQAAGVDRYEKALIAFHRDGFGGLQHTSMFIFKHLQDHQNFYRRLLNGTNGLATYRAIQSFLADGIGRGALWSGQKIDDSERLFLSGGAMAIIIGWLDTKPEPGIGYRAVALRVSEIIGSYLQDRNGLRNQELIGSA